MLNSQTTHAGLVYRNCNMNIIKNRYSYFLISLLIIIPGLIFLIIYWVNIKAPLPLGIDFTVGSLLEVQFEGARPASATVHEAFLKFAPESDPIVQPLGDDSFAIRSRTIDDATKGQIVAELDDKSDGTVT